MNLLENYLSGFERDMNRHAVKHGRMPEERAVHDITRLLVTQVKQAEISNGTEGLPVNMLAGMLAAAIVRGIARKKAGKG